MMNGFSGVLRLSFFSLMIIFLAVSGPVVAQMSKAQNDYLEQRRSIKTDDPDALFRLADWVWKKYPDNLELLDNAGMDLKEALKLKPDHRRAKLLAIQVDAKIKMLKENTGPKDAGVVAQPAVSDKFLLNDRDILWVRLREYKPAVDKRLSIKFENRVLQRYCDSMRGSDVDGWDKIGKEKRFYNMPYWKRMDEILRNRPDDISLLQDIHITRDPRFMVDFRSKVWPVVQQSCASANCHGGPRPVGGFKLFNIASSNEKIDFTNFIILSGFGRTGHKIIDRQRVENSLLLQYGLNSKVAKKLHPKVGGADFKPAFLSMNSASYKNIRKWIASLEGPMAPDYRLEYKPPFGMKLNTSGTPDLPPGATETEKQE